MHCHQNATIIRLIHARDFFTWKICHIDFFNSFLSKIQFQVDQTKNISKVCHRLFVKKIDVNLYCMFLTGFDRCKKTMKQIALEGPVSLMKISSIIGLD